MLCPEWFAQTNIYQELAILTLRLGREICGYFEKKIACYILSTVDFHKLELSQIRIFQKLEPAIL